MKRQTLILIGSLFIAFLISTIGFAAEMTGKCPMCGMNLSGNENTVYEIVYTDNTTEVYCCPHCGLYMHTTKKATVKSARARSFISGEWMDPAKMTFVYNSSAVPACAPSWIGFSSKEEAQKFQKGFGGKVYSFQEALTERAKQPKDMKM